MGMTAEKHRSRVRRMITNARNDVVEVGFIKKDGTERVMRVFKDMKVERDGVSKSHKEGARVRAVQNPNLINVVDADKGAPRSINLDTTFMFKDGDKETRFALRDEWVD